jgi:hypothetical protein
MSIGLAMRVWRSAYSGVSVMHRLSSVANLFLACIPVAALGFAAMLEVARVV